MDFEDKKENIQPLRGGRNVEQLEHAFESTESWEVERKSHEELIRNYAGDDPLEPWYAYIFWMEQTNVSSGKPMILEDALRRCAQQFENDARYMQDHRFIKLCIKYIDSQPSPVELYSELYNRGVGTLCSELYIAWAYYYDAVDNFAKTEEVFQKGLGAGAEPKDKLEQAHTSFGFSMSQRLLHKDEYSQMKFQSTMDERRNALTSLRASRAKHVGSIRTGLAVKSYRPGIVNQENMPSNSSTQNAPANAIIYSDESGSSGTGNSIVRPFSSVHNDTENIIESARLAKSQGTHKKAVLFNRHHIPSFDIPMDEENFQPIPILLENYSRGIQLASRFCRKNKPQTPFELSICVVDPNERAIPMYDKIRLYCRADKQRAKDGGDTTEYSPEELRAYRYFLRNGTENQYTKEHVCIWGFGYDIRIRLHPLHVRESKSKEEVKSNFPIEECDMSIKTKMREMYADPVEEKCIEELLMVKWREGKIKRCVDRRYQDDIDPVDMDETQVESQRISMGGARFSIAPSIQVDMIKGEQRRQRSTIFPAYQVVGSAVPCIAEETEEELSNRSTLARRSNEKMLPQFLTAEAGPSADDNQEVFQKRLPDDVLEQTVSKKEDTRPTPRKCVIAYDNVQKAAKSNKIDDVPAASEKIEIFADDSAEHLEREELIAKPMTSCASDQPYYPNDTCSTQMFNLFVKNISTPLGPSHKPSQMSAVTGMTKRLVVFVDDDAADDHCSKPFPQKEIHVQKDGSPSMPSSESVNNPVSEAKINDENAVPVVDSSTPPSTSTSSSSACNSTQSNKQLSTIMERTETSTTSSSAVAVVTKSSVECQTPSPEPNFTAAGNEMNVPASKLTVCETVEAPKGVFFKPPLMNDEPTSFGIHVDSTETMANIPLLLKRDLPPAAISVDEKENECVLRGTAAPLHSIVVAQSIPFESTNATPLAMGAFFHLPEEATFTGTGPSSNQRNLSHMVQREMEANSIASFRMATERTNTVPLQLVKPQYTIPEAVFNAPACLSVNSIVTSDSSTTAHMTTMGANTTPTVQKKDCESPKKRNSSLLELLNATFSPKVGGSIVAGVSDDKERGGDLGQEVETKRDSFNLSDLIKTPKAKNVSSGLAEDNVPALELLPVPGVSCTDLTYLPVAHIKMEKSLILDASLELPNFSTAAPIVCQAAVLSAKSNAKKIPISAGSAAKIVLDEFPSPKPAAGESERNSLDDINTAVFALNINQAVNSTIIESGIKTPHKQAPTINQLQWPGAGSQQFTITNVQGGVTNHASLLFPPPREVIDLSDATEPISKQISPFASPQDPDTNASIYLPRPAISQDEEHWEEIDEHFDPQMNNEYQRRPVDMDCTMQHIKAYTSAEEIDPFDRQLQEAFLDRLDFMNYISELPSCTLVNKVQPLKKGVLVEIQEGGDAFEVQQRIGKGAYGTVYCATHISTGQHVALKQERPANLWEFYICLEIRSRLTNPDILPGIMSIDHAIVGNNASIFVSSYSRYGNILDVCNLINKVTNRNVDEFIAMIISAQILSIVDHLHSCQIIHADIKPDNFLLISPIDLHANVPCVQLIDFGESIDMKLFQKDVTFKKVITTDGFTCIEMKEQKQWTYQPDLFGVAATSHVILFGKYMQVQKNIVNWSIKTVMPRYFKKTVWENYFAALLNIRDCDHLPNLQNLRTAFLEEIALREKYIRSKIAEFNQALATPK